MDNMDQYTEALARGAEVFRRNTDVFTRMWVDFANKMAMSSLAFQAGSTPPEAGREVRGAAFKAMSDYFEELMRSPQFLDAMKQSMDTALNLRKQFDSFLSTMQHEMQGVAREDVDSLMLTMRHMETRMLDRMEDLAGRIDALEQQLKAAKKTPANGHAQSRRRPQPEPAAKQEARRRK